MSYIMKNGIGFIKLFILLPSILFLPLNMHGQYFLSDTNFSAVVGSGARALGMGGAFIAIADDPTAASWNPGGLGQLEQPGLALVFRHQNYSASYPAFSTFTGFNGPENKSANSSGIDFISFTYPLRFGDFKIVPQFSFQRSISYTLDASMNNVPFSEYEFGHNPDKSVFQGYYTSKNKFTGGLDTYSFSFGSTLFGRVNIGFSANFWTNGFRGNETLILSGESSPVDSPDFTFNTLYKSIDELNVEIKAFTFNVGILVELLENFKFGLVFKSGDNADINYNTFGRTEEAIGSTVPVIEENSSSDKTRLEWPATWGAGISYRPIDVLTLSFDFTTTRWSRSIFSDLDLGDGFEGPKYYPSFRAVDNEEGLTQKDTQQFRFGLEYIFIGSKAYIPLRIGFFSDSQYFTDSSGRRVTFFGITGGIGIKKGPISFDTAFLYEWGNYLRSNFDYTLTYQRDLRIYSSLMFSF
jgi:long-subunit fatty acid transport protein